MTMGRDELIGKTLGTFEILEEIGRGGMATVYRARQVTMNRIVAVKVLPRHLLHDPGFYERFEREVEVISHLEHPHIVPIYEYGQSDGIPYIAMRYLGGGSLETVIRRRIPELSELEKPLRQIGQALDYAHQQGIIHRDLKPGNIMLDENNNAYLSDFGIARVLGSNMTGSMIVGTPAYMSPEQANGMPIDGRSDIYALGVVLFEMLTGREPYQADTPMAILLKHINEPMPPISDYREDIPPQVEVVVQRATAKDPDDRYTSPGTMVEAFSAAVRGESLPDTGVRRKAVADRATIAAPMQSTSPSAASTTAMEPVPAANRAIIVILGTVIILLLGGGLFLAVLSNRPPNDNRNLMPTAFPRASTITGRNYTVSIPNDWIPPALFLDQSTAERQLHIWQTSDSTAFVTLALVEADTDGDAAIQAAISAYHDQYYAAQNLQLIDEAPPAEDGTIRRSYRIGEGSTFAPGQMDVFYQPREPYLAVLELYTADSTGNTLVPSLQLILDSLRVRPERDA